MIHLAIGRVGVGVIFKGHANKLVGVDVAFLDHFADIDVLDRVVVIAELEIATGRLEVGGLQSCAEGIGLSVIDAVSIAESNRLAVSKPWLA
jgi:hypothetical protein